MKLSLVAARDAFGEGDFNAALMNYYGILNWLIPSKRAKYFKEFCDALQGLLSDESIENQQKIVWLKMSCELFEQKPTLLNKCAEFFFSIGRYLEAFDYACKATKNDERHERLHAIVNRENIKSNIMDQWHWVMLNDAHRNDAYASAIKIVLNETPNSRVLDIGGGTSFLSLIAKRYSANVYCCEVDGNMAELAKRIAASSGVHIINKHSMEMTSDDTDAQKMNVLITETMDSGLLGENIVMSLLDAHQRLLTADAQIIPNQAAVYACLIESQSITDEHLAIIKGNRFVSPFVLTDFGTDLSDGCEPYWCCHADELKGHFKYLSGSIPVFKINFNDRSQLEQVSNGVHEEHTINVHRKGRVHAIMAWFRCTLYPGAPVISTNVESESCWQQAIYPVEEPFLVSDGDQCVVAIDAFRNRFCCQLKRCDEDKLLNAAAAVDSVEDEWEMLPEKCEKSCSTIEKPFNGNDDDEEMDLNEWERASKQTSSGVKCVAVIDSIAANGDMRIITLNTTNSQVNDVVEMEVDDEFLKIKKSDLEERLEYRNRHSISKTNVLLQTDFLFLNDGALVQFFSNSIRALIKSGAALQHGRVRVVDLSGIASVSGALASYNKFYRSLCLYRTDDYRMLMNAFDVTDQQCMLRKIDESGITCCGDVLFCWPITSSGCLCENSLTDIVEWKMRNVNGIVIPSTIRICAQLIKCPKIVNRSKPNKHSHCGVDLSAINQLSISYYYDVEPSTLKCEKLSDPFEILTLCFDTPLPTEVGKLPNFLQQVDVRSEVKATQSGSVDGLLYWFEMGHQDVRYSALSDDTNTRCAIHLFNESVLVNSNDRLTFLSSLFHSNLIIELQ